VLIIAAAVDHIGYGHPTCKNIKKKFWNVNKRQKRQKRANDYINKMFVLRWMLMPDMSKPKKIENTISVIISKVNLFM